MTISKTIKKFEKRISKTKVKPKRFFASCSLSHLFNSSKVGLRQPDINMSKSCGKMCMKEQRQWSDLPNDLLSDIAEGLDPLDIVSFCSVCKAWNYAASTASAKLESTQDYEPWFLLYGDDHKKSDECLLVTDTGKKYTMRLPQLVGTTCLASNEGWLLVFKQGLGDSGGSIFFFRPFSHTKIDLPNFPTSKLSNHVAAVSCPPTSQDCKVCVVSRCNDDEVEVNVLHRGANTWVGHKISSPRNSLDTIKCATYLKEEFYFFDHIGRMLILSSEKNETRSRFSKSIPASAKKEESSVSCYFVRTYFKRTDMKKKLGLADHDEGVSFSICGTQTQLNGLNKFVYNESISTDHAEESKTKSHQFKGVWIYPRFYQISPKLQSW